MQFVEPLHSQGLCVDAVTDMRVSKDGGAVLDFPFKSSKSLHKKAEPWNWMTERFFMGNKRGLHYSRTMVTAMNGFSTEAVWSPLLFTFDFGFKLDFLLLLSAWV